MIAVFVKLGQEDVTTPLAGLPVKGNFLAFFRRGISGHIDVLVRDYHSMI